MKKTKVNFWLDILIFIDFVGVIFTGVLLHRFPPELKESLVMGINRYDWGDLHWMLCLFLILLTVAHLILHWSWLKTSFKKHLKVGPKLLAGVALIVFLLSGIIAPVYMTSGFPNRKEFKETYPKTLSGEAEETAELSDYR